MTATDSAARVSTARLVLIPGVITLAVTILRLVGELQHWPTVLFNPAPGGGGAIVGISWLPIIFGPYFALKLAGAGEGPGSVGKAIGMTLLGLLVLVGGGFLVATSQFQSMGKAAGGFLLMAAAAVIPLSGWPSLTKTLLAYAYAARFPVAILMIFALRGNWGTHYDAPPPNFPEMGFLPKYFLIAFLPQLVLWIAFTVIVGSLFGAVTVAIAHRGKSAPQTAA